MVYQWKQSRFNADAQKVGDELESINERTAENVVKVARKKPKSELHKCFEWDNSIAGEEYRKEQARLIMRMITVQEEITTNKGEQQLITVRAFESVRFSSEEGNDKYMTYSKLSEVLSDADLKAQVMSRLYSTIAEARETIKAYSYLDESLSKVDAKLAEAMGFMRK